MYLNFFILISLLITINASGLDRELKYAAAFDNDLYERVLDPQKCEEQLIFLRRNLGVAMQFIDASGKIPNGILIGNLADLGGYHQCLEIRHSADDVNIEGKYCMIRVPLNQNRVGSIASPSFPFIGDVWPTLDNNTIKNVERIMTVQKQAELMLDAGNSTTSRTMSSNLASGLTLSLGICVPKVCRSKQVIDSINFLNVTFNEDFCRLPNDKPISIADYLATAIFSLILLITILSTSYDLYQTYVLKKDKSQISPAYRCFSIYTNTIRLLSFNNPSGTMECIDGIRAISMIWVVIGHTYYISTLTFMTNPSKIMSWLRSFTSVWINSAPISVDTFFTLSGILCVYTIIGKINRCQFLKSLHLFYLHRLLRMFPLLAAMILLQASVFHRVSDGPAWNRVGQATESCRMRWWAALLHVQNYIRPLNMCLPHTWYLSVDIQLYIVSPIVIIWLFGSTVIASSALVAVVLISLTITSTYSFVNDYPASVFNPSRSARDYFTVYYINTLTRASPFCVGMVFGYVLHKFKGKTIYLRKSFVAIAWIATLALMGFCIFSIYPIIQIDHNSQFFDNFLNSYMRGIWAMTLGWLIFACVHGYGGAINWFLSHQIWKIPARLSYAMYLVHYPIMLVANGSMTSTYFFSDANALYRGGGDLVFTMIAAFVLCIIIDAPFSTILKLILDKVSGRRKPNQKLKTESQINIVENGENVKKLNHVA